VQVPSGAKILDLAPANCNTNDDVCSSAIADFGAFTPDHVTPETVRFLSAYILNSSPL